MTKMFGNSKYIKHSLWLVLVVSLIPVAWTQPLGVYQHGTVVRMRMSDCPFSHHGVLAAFGSPAAQGAEIAIETCPEYTLISDTVVYVIVGRSSGQLIPLADVIDFRLHNNEMVVRIDDARHESKFTVKEMILRSEWDLVQKHVADQLSTSRSPEEVAATRTTN